MKIIYSFNKKGFEADYWTREIAAASTPECQFIPFNHGPYLNPMQYIRAQLLDNLYYEEHPGLKRMYTDIQAKIQEVGADVLLADNCHPYHPDFLRNLNIYKVLHTGDGAISAYDRDFAYLHAYDHVIIHSPAYSRDMDMAEKVRYCGMKNVDFVPLGAFEQAYDTSKTSESLFDHDRDIDIIFIGCAYLNKLPIFAAMKSEFGRRLVMHGVFGWKKNAYFNVKYGFPGWITPINFEEYVPLYQRAKIGFNVHNRGKYGIGSYRLFDLPANGIMQISDGGEFLGRYYEMDREVVGYDTTDELIRKVKYYLDHDDERMAIAKNGFERVMSEYRFADLLRRCGALIKQTMERDTLDILPDENL